MFIWNKTNDPTNEFECGHTLIPPISSDGGNINQVERTLLSVVFISSPSPLLCSTLYHIFAHVLAFSVTSPWQPVMLQMQRRVNASKAATRRGKIFCDDSGWHQIQWPAMLAAASSAALSGLFSTPWRDLLHATMFTGCFFICSSHFFAFAQVNDLLLFSEHEYLSDFSLSFGLMQSASWACLPFIIPFSSACRTSSEFFTSQVSQESGCNVLYLCCSNSLPAPSPSLLPTELISGKNSDCCLLISHTWIVLYQQTCPSFSSQTV